MKYMNIQVSIHPSSVTSIRSNSQTISLVNYFLSFFCVMVSKQTNKQNKN